MSLDRDGLPSVFVGLDLSLRRAAACAIPADWDATSLEGIETEVFGSSVKNDADERKRLMRLHDIANGITAFVQKYRFARVYVEQYAFSQGLAHAHGLGEAGGVVKYRIWRKCGYVATPVVASSARKTLLVKCPRSNAKAFVQRNVRRLEGKAREWTDDEIDAFVVANHARAVAGLPAMSFQGV